MHDLLSDKSVIFLMLAIRSITRLSETECFLQKDMRND